jgi:hypothetical protein
MNHVVNIGLFRDACANNVVCAEKCFMGIMCATTCCIPVKIYNLYGGTVDINSPDSPDANGLLVGIIQC